MASEIRARDACWNSRDHGKSGERPRKKTKIVMPMPARSKNALDTEDLNFRRSWRAPARLIMFQEAVTDTEVREFQQSVPRTDGGPTRFHVE